MKHIILISIDNLRYDCIGYQPDKKELQKYDVLKHLETPTLDEISEHSLCFTQCISSGTYTTAAHASLLTGMYPPGHGVRAFYKTKLHKDVYTIAEMMKVFGYTTIMATDTLFLFNPLEMNRGFDYVFEKDDFNLFSFIEKNNKEKIFLFVHFYDVHEPFMFSEHKAFDNSDYFRELQGLFESFNITFPSTVSDGALIWKTLKEQLGQKVDILLPLFVKGVTKFDKNRFRVFIDNLRKLKLLDDGLMIVLSDHGEGKISSKEPEKFTHGGDAFDNVIRIPLLLYHRDFSRKVLDNLTSIVDIFPTIFELALQKEAKDLLPYQLDGQSLTSSKEREFVYSERCSLKMFKLHFNLAMSSSVLWQRAIRTRKEKFVLYGEPEWRPAIDSGKMNDREFLKSVYRKLIPQFEEYDEYFENLHKLNRGDITREELIKRFYYESYDLYDLTNDPFEENPIKVGIVPEHLASCKTRIFKISGSPVYSDDIFPPLNNSVVRRIAWNLLEDEMKEPLDVISDNKNLFNELIGKFFERNKDMPTEEFLRKCSMVFLNEEPEDTYFTEIMKLIQDGVPRETVFMTKIFQIIEFRTADNTGNSFITSVEKLKQMEKETAQKDRLITELQNRLTEKESTLQQMLSSRTWKLGQLYAKLIGFFTTKENISKAPSPSPSPLRAMAAGGEGYLISPPLTGGDEGEGDLCGFTNDLISNSISSKKNINQGAGSQPSQVNSAAAESLPLEIMLITNFECVYHCSYCFAYKPRNKGEYRKHDAREWEDLFLSFYNKYGKCNLILSGGEPFFYKDSVDFVINTTKYHHVHAGTNLFLEKDVLERIASQSKKENLYISASFHPESANLETFIEKLLFLKDKGIAVRANGVLFPEHLNRMVEIYNRFKETSIPIGFFPYIGEYKGRKFPDEYSEDELKIIAGLPVWHQSPRDSKIQIPRTKGMLCYAGVKTIYINPNGEVRRCMSAHDIIGNAFDENFSLLKKPEPCPLDICDCGLYWKYHISNKLAGKNT